jgi:hypothetical protein
MNPIDFLHLQLRMEGKEVVNGNLLRQVEIVHDEEMPLAAIASLSSDELVLYYDESLSTELHAELDRQIPNISFPDIDPVINVLQSHSFKLDIGHYKTYVFPAHYKDIETDEVKLYPRTDPKIQAFDFGGFTEHVHAIERDGMIVSACVSAKENDHCGEAWVLTDENYRHQGLAQKVVSIWARDLILSGKIPLYSHKITNIGSAKLAHRLGLEPVFEEITVSP